MRTSKLNNSSIESLRDYYHSIHDAERVEVIELLGGMEEPEASRELIQFYEECEWRGTRFTIIQALERNPTQRGLEFLFRLTQKQDDISVAEAAIRSLGQTHHRMAGLFLTNYYPRCPAALKPALVGALGQIPDRTLAVEFLAELPKAIQAQQIPLVRNLVVTLGELKILEALPLLREIALQKQNPTNALCALVAIGKTGRDLKALESLENRFRDDLFEYQIFSSVRAQIQFRSQWKLEDYLSRIFESHKIHPTLPYELTHFLETDVKEGLKLFSGEKHFEKLCFALSKVDFPNSATWYTELLDLKRLTTPQKSLVFQSLSQHRNSTLLPPLLLLQEDEGHRSAQWLETAALCLPDAEREFKSHFESKIYRELSDNDKIAAINALNNFALIIQTNAEKLQAVTRILETALEMETSLPVQGRIIRALGYLGIHSKKGTTFAKNFLSEVSKAQDLSTDSVSNLVGSILKYLELCPDKNCTGSLMALLDVIALPTCRTALKVALMRAFTSFPSVPESNIKKIELFVKSSLESFESEEALTIAALNLFRVWKVPTLKNLLSAVMNTMKGNSRIQLTAIIALKSFPGEEPVEKIGGFLNSNLESLAGRALDTLTSLPGLRAKRLIIDFLKDHAADIEICDKVIRCFKLPEGQNDYFVKVLDDILNKFPQHPLSDGLMGLREKLSNEIIGRGRLGFIPKGEDIEIIDRELSGKILGYAAFDESTKSALRSAELPYQHREMFDEYVDKGSSVIEYCKAIDLLLEKALGKKMIFPKLEHSLHEFQNVLHSVGLHEDYPSAQYVLKQMDLEKHFNTQSLPLHKMSIVAYGIRTGRIVNQQFRILDGLRAWAVMLLLFSRKIQGAKPVIFLKNVTDDQIIHFSKSLMKLQDIRNPVAHRQTVVKFLALDEVRSEVFSLLSAFQKMIT